MTSSSSSFVLSLPSLSIPHDDDDGDDDDDDDDDDDGDDDDDDDGEEEIPDGVVMLDLRGNPCSYHVEELAQRLPELEVRRRREGGREGVEEEEEEE